MTYKFIDSTTIKPATDKIIQIGDAYISNPTEDHFRQNGYTDLMVDAEPVYDAETQMTVPNYEDGDPIVQHWTVTDKPPVPVAPPSLEERVDACEDMLIDMFNFM